MRTTHLRGDERPSDECRPHKPPRVDPRKDDPFGLGPEHDEQRPYSPTRSKLYIPYYPNDLGDRNIPFPAGVLSWWCQGLRITRPDGTPHLGKLDRGVTYNIAVSVANGGSASAAAEVALYWADPTAGFGPPHLRRKPELSSVCSLGVRPGCIDDATFTLTPTAATPNHICLLAVVSALDDSASGSWDPLSDRHYAQRNVDIVQVKQNGIGSFSFFATNPLNEAATVALSVLPSTAEQLHELTKYFGLEARELRAQSVGLTVGKEGDIERPQSRLEIELAPRQRRLCQGVIATETMRRGELSAVTVEMTARPTRGGRDNTVGRGSFGAIVLVE